MEKVKINVKGMHCKSCEALVNEDLLDLDGVSTVDASCDEDLVLVEFDPEKVELKKIKKIISDNGYKVE